ncbi:MAG: T9SS type A sorting domain-containing protein [Chitinophagaceae bacterium]
MINHAGGYWAYVSDVNGCEFAAAVHPVNYVEVPEGKISGKQDQCINVAYTLDGGAPVDVLGGTHHEWIRDGVLISSFGNSVTELFTAPGVHTYYLITVVSNPGGGFCRDTSDAFVVTVHGAAAPPLISFSILDCTDYTVQLSASSAYAGTFNWSHGASGTPVLAYSGGPYRVYLTDIYGCPSHSDIYVPKSPQEYLWIFPTGCYNLCIEDAPYKLLGPTASFSHYDWIKNGTADVSGGGLVPDYTVSAPGTYNLALANTYCADTSEDMDVTFVPCPPICGNNVIFDVLGTSHISMPLCRDYINIMLGDLSGPPPGRPYSISAKHGVVLPSGGSLPAPPVPTTFRYIADPGFSGLTDTLTLRVTMPDGSICLITRFVTFTTAPCDNSLARLTEDGMEKTITTTATAKLILAPNPAQDMVRVDYGFVGESVHRFVEVYDMTGKLVSRTGVQEATGTLTLQLDQLSSGLYQVILRQDNKVSLRSKLSVTH